MLPQLCNITQVFFLVLIQKDPFAHHLTSTLNMQTINNISIAPETYNNGARI